MGYQIRFEKTVNKDTKILFLTEGLLLRQVTMLYIINKYIDFILLIETIIVYNGSVIFIFIFIIGLWGGFIVTI